jgi:hypothetical protein
MLRPTVSRPVLVSSTHLGPRPDSYCCQTRAGLSMWGPLSEERTGLSFTIANGPRQRAHSRVRVPRESWLYFTVSDSRLPQPWGTGPCIYIPQEQGGPLISPGTGFLSGHLQLAGLQWRYSNPPPRGLSLTDSTSDCSCNPHYILPWLPQHSWAANVAPSCVIRLTTVKTLHKTSI